VGDRPLSEVHRVVGVVVDRLRDDGVRDGLVSQPAFEREPVTLGKGLSPASDLTAATVVRRGGVNRGVIRERPEVPPSPGSTFALLRPTGTRRHSPRTDRPGARPRRCTAVPRWGGVPSGDLGGLHRDLLAVSDHVGTVGPPVAGALAGSAALTTE